MANPALNQLEFTHSGYIRLLRQLIGAGYTFSSFSECRTLAERSKAFVLMRHDIDFDLQKAADMAAIEEGEGVIATYFFMVRTEHYNVFSKAGTATVKEILCRGHRLGLHFDCASYPEFKKAEEFAEACRLEASMLQQWFGQAVEIVSYHRPAPDVLSGAPELSAPLDNTYLPFFTRQMHYSSDSRGEWKHGTPLESKAFADGAPLHILIHPIWWCAESTEPEPVLHRLLKQKQLVFQRSFAENCTIFKHYETP